MNCQEGIAYDWKRTLHPIGENQFPANTDALKVILKRDAIWTSHSLKWLSFGVTLHRSLQEY